MSDDPESRARARIGTVLSEKWTLESLLGVGGMAAVYAARHRNGARAAIKVLHPELSRQKDIRERFLREGYAANRVEHEGAVKVLDDDVVSSGEEAGTAYLVMELLDGCSLQSRLDHGASVGEREFLAIAEAVLEVLEAAHARGVVHRDLKPENLFLLTPRDEEQVGRPRVKVLDFGLARIADGQSNTAYGLALGTPSFMSPEQAAGKVDEIDGRTDIFALGTTGFRVRTGRKIHDAAGAVELVTKMASLPAPPIASVCADVSPPFARVIDRALKFRREDRYQSAAAMRSDVQRAMVELDGFARTVLSLELPPTSSRGRATQGRARKSRASLPVLPGRRARHRRSTLPWVLFLGCGALAVSVWLFMSKTAGAPAEGATSTGGLVPAGSNFEPTPARGGSDAAVSSGATATSSRPATDAHHVSPAAIPTPAAAARSAAARSRKPR